MSHAALVNAGLLYIVVVQPLLLVVFIRAVIRAPSGPADSASEPEPEPPAPQISAPAPPEPARLPVRPATWPPSSAAGPSAEPDYVGRHIARGGPPWGPAPKPPGASW
jgi:hypothetical protein